MRTGVRMPLSIGSPATRLRWVLSDALAVTTRNLLHVPRMPDRIIGVVVQPIMFGLLLPLVLGSAIKLPGAGGYPEYLVAGLVVQSTAFAAVSAAVGIAGDLRQGIVDRFHLLPMVRSAVLIGRLCAELVQALIGVGIIVLCGLAVGWRIRGGALHALGALGVLLAFAFTMKWVGILTGLLGRAPEAATALSFVWIFPFILVADTIVPTNLMPQPLRLIAEWNPASAQAAALRELCGNPAPHSAAWPLEHPVVAALGWSLLISGVLAPLAVRRYRTATSH